MTECVANSLGKRKSGEKPIDKSPGVQQCHTFAENGDSVGLAVRCCKPADINANFEVEVADIEEYPHWYTQAWAKNEYCQQTPIDDFAYYSYGGKNYVIVGCGGWYGTDKPFKYQYAPSPGMARDTQAERLTGTKVISGAPGTFNTGECKTQRSDQTGFVAALGIGAYISDGQLDCITKESDSASYDPSSGHFHSTAKCPIEYMSFDCSAFIDIYFGQCSVSSAITTFGASFDGNNGCQAQGNTVQVRAQVSCCRQ